MSDASLQFLATTVTPVHIDHADLFATSPLPQALLDAAWRVVQANTAWTALVGEVQGVSWYDLVHPADLARDLPAAGRLQTGVLPAFRAIIRLRTPTGGWLPAELVVAALTAGQAGVLVTALPLTGAPPAGGQHASPETVSIGSVDGRQLAAALSHDVRQHARLAAVYCSLLARGDLNERQRAQLKVVASHTDRLQQVLVPLVHWLRLADEPLNRQPCALAGLWATAIADLPADFTQGDLPVIDGDPLLLGELLREVVLNAVRFHPGRARIDVQATRTAHGWELTISDDGPGIPAKERGRVLLPLHRLHSWEEVEGHGMGLALAARIAARHDGELCIGSGPAGGCRVQVRLAG